MSQEKIQCQKCGQLSPRNMHNKCIYCGCVYDREDHYSEDETKDKLDQLEKANQEDRAALEEFYRKEKAREEERRKSSAYTGVGPIGGSF